MVDERRRVDVAESGERGSPASVVLARGEVVLGSPERVVKESTMSMMKRSLGVISVLAIVFASAVPALAQHGSHALAQTPAAAKVNETGAALRDFWVGHVFWVRNVVVSTFAGNQPAAATAEREVVANARQLAAAIEPYYGKEASEKLFGLLAEIARFLSGANPNLPFDTLNGLLLAHGGHHVLQIQQVQGKLYAQEARTWEAMKGHMYVISDALAAAIAKQFPEQFS